MVINPRIFKGNMTSDDHGLRSVQSLEPVVLFHFTPNYFFLSSLNSLSCFPAFTSNARYTHQCNLFSFLVLFFFIWAHTMFVSLPLQIFEISKYSNKVLLDIFGKNYFSSLNYWINVILGLIKLLISSLNYGNLSI